jgi:dTDP-4-dehydrorhamnose 3,5-epimerase-like enzyme
MTRKGIILAGGSRTRDSLLEARQLIATPLAIPDVVLIESKVLGDERCILCNDDTLRIQWPTGIQPVLSAKDAQGKAFTEAEVFA